MTYRARYDIIIMEVIGAEKQKGGSVGKHDKEKDETLKEQVVIEVLKGIAYALGSTATECLIKMLLKK